MNYPLVKSVKPPKKKEQLDIDKDRLTPVNELTKLTARSSGEFKGCSYCLSSIYNWVIGVDTEGYLVLIPIKKED